MTSLSGYGSMAALRRSRRSSINPSIRASAWWAASMTSMGLPWELGLAETHQTLLMNGLRNKVRIETALDAMCSHAF